MYMSDQGVFLSKWPHNRRIILAKEQLGHSYIFWTMPIFIFCQFANFGNQSLCKILILLNCSITFVLKNVLQFAHQFVHHFYMLSIVWKNFNTYLIAQTSLGKPADLYKGTLRILIFSWCICTLSQLKDPCLSNLK